MRRHPLQIAVVAVVVLCLALATPGTARSLGPIQGDADCSGAITMADAVTILRHASSVSVSPCALPANTDCADGVTAADVLIVARYLAGFQTHPVACDAVGQPLGAVRLAIDSGLEPNQDTLPGLGGGPPRNVATAIGPDGVQVDFVADEIILKPASDTALQDFLDRYNGVVIRDGSLSEAPSTASTPVNQRYHLIRIDPATSTLADLSDNIEDAGLQGNFVFSDRKAQSLAAIIVRERDSGISVNIVAYPGTWNEHPTAVDSRGIPNAWIDAEKLPYMMDSSPLSVGVDRAWAYMKYQLLPPDNGVFEPVRIGVVDSGFALDTSTGKPTMGNLDYLYFGAKPVQYDEAGDDGFAGGESLVKCSGGKACPWHGQGSFGVCCARPHNNYGIAGTGGEVVLPILVNVDGSFYTMGDGIRRAYAMGANVITISMSGDCGFWCDLSTADGNLEDYVNTATNGGAIVLASAGNSGIDISDREIIPCKTSRVICVGGVNADGTNAYNYGNGVDMWAPHNVLSTTTPLTLGGDPNKIGNDALYAFGGTSAATPFLAGIVGMMKAVNPALKWDSAQSILQSTANPGGDSRVSKGYVDALRAVMASRANQVPSVQITLPFSGSSRTYKSVIFRAVVTDGDPGSGLDRFSGQTTVGFYGSSGLICQTTSIKYYGTQPTYECISDVEPGAQQVQAKVTDPFGGEGSASIPVVFTSGPPVASVTKPADNATFYSNQLIRFEASVTDPDESPFPGDQIVWSSSIDGPLSVGAEFNTFLSQGAHTITVRATDERGLTDEASITVNVLSGAGIPSVFISQPSNGSVHGAAPWITTFSGFSSDAEDGPLTGNSLVWTSNVDGILGYGATIQFALTGATNCQQAHKQHIIRLTATDSDNHSSYSEITIYVGPFC